MTAVGAAAGALAQNNGPSFEVASLKPSSPGARGGRKGGDPGYFSVRNRTLLNLVQVAYGLADYQVTGTAKWMGADQFDVEAKPAQAASREQMLLMLRSLLDERFRLRFHHETKQMAAYVLTVAKGGPKFGSRFHKTDNDGLMAESGKPNSDLGIFMGGDLAGFASLLRRNMRLFYPDDSVFVGEAPPVIDRTGLAGDYVIYLKVSGPKDDLVAAVEEQLGLRMDMHKVPVDVMVIDSAMKPEGN